MQIACQCAAAPTAHSHGTETRVRRLDDGQEFTMHCAWLEQPGYEVVYQRETLRVWVSWRDVARTLLRANRTEGEKP